MRLVGFTAAVSPGKLGQSGTGLGTGEGGQLGPEPLNTKPPTQPLRCKHVITKGESGNDDSTTGRGGGAGRTDRGRQESRFLWCPGTGPIPVFSQHTP